MIDAYTSVLEVDSLHKARETASNGNSIAIVIRGRPRWVVFQCPCECGEVLSINVDARAGKAWKLRLDNRLLSLRPSVWKTAGCRSHFVLWENEVWILRGWSVVNRT